MLKHTVTAMALTLSSLALGQAVKGADIDVTSGGKAYKSYLSAPASATVKPAVILLHSFNGMEQGYKDLVDELAGAGFVTLALGWQTFEKEPTDATVKALVEDGLKALAARNDVNMNAVGLTGFCAGGRYTMLLLPQIKEFKSGVAWYGFPEQGGTAAKPQPPSAVINQLSAPLLILHGTRDQPSPVAGIYDYAKKLDAANKNFKLVVYQGEPHGFLLREGKIADTSASRDARREMLDYFRDTLK
ncbi:dienelactone hydrolase family protein [Deinococcus aerophilus]|uniref:Dienelactone hydrolase family protein n=1 Tax=Deinococcus aerophilus TaxID=522488 RepID=A0ABQ2H064_9DEIO|nr:dienelactone hydrolase family protein [Deinococcus aerophilus]GGM20786.1 dienelactone hydrolase family protein [Deinococcus aerophilus]